MLRIRERLLRGSSLFFLRNNDGTTPRLLEEDSEGEIFIWETCYFVLSIQVVHQWAEERARLCRLRSQDLSDTCT